MQCFIPFEVNFWHIQIQMELRNYRIPLSHVISFSVLLSLLQVSLANLYICWHCKVYVTP